MGGSAPQAPRDLSLFSSRVDGFSLALISDCHTMERLDRRIGQRRDATRAPNQARSGWRPSGRLLVNPAARPKNNGDHALMSPAPRRTKLVSVEKTAPGVHIEKPTWRFCE